VALIYAQLNPQQPTVTFDIAGSRLCCARKVGGWASDTFNVSGVRKDCVFLRAGESSFGVGFRRVCRRPSRVVGMCGRGTSLLTPLCAAEYCAY